MTPESQPTVPPLASNADAQALNRRQFIVLSTTAACACAAGLLPCGTAMAQNEPKPVDVGDLKSFDKDGVNDAFLKTDRILVIRQDKKIYAVTARCSHKGGIIRVREGEMVCANHGAKFDLQGKPTKGPAEEALDRLGISVNAEGRVIVDPSKRFDEKKWDKPGAFVKAAN